MEGLGKGVTESVLCRKILLDTGGTEWRRRGLEVETGVSGKVSEGGEIVAQPREVEKMIRCMSVF